MKKHKIEFTKEELSKLWLSLGYYCQVAVDSDNYRMLVERELMLKMRATFYRRMFEMGFSNKPTSKVTLTQIQVDLIWHTQCENAHMREVLLKIGSKTHSYAA